MYIVINWIHFLSLNKKNDSSMSALLNLSGALMSTGTGVAKNLYQLGNKTVDVVASSIKKTGDTLNNKISKIDDNINSNISKSTDKFGAKLMEINENPLMPLDKVQMGGSENGIMMMALTVISVIIAIMLIILMAYMVYKFYKYNQTPSMVMSSFVNGVTAYMYPKKSALTMHSYK